MGTIAAITESRAAVNKKFLNGVFGWMGAGFGLTALLSYGVYTSPELMGLFLKDNHFTGLGYLALFAPLIFVFILSSGFKRFSYFTLAILFLCYAAIMGISLSFIFLVFTGESVYDTFIIAAFMYGTMATFGYAAKFNLTRMGNILLMALVGIILASLINLVAGSDLFSYIISFIGVFVFCGLTAWDVQKLKKLAGEPVAEIRSKLSILGALTLYLDFINLFFSLLPFFGRKRIGVR